MPSTIPYDPSLALGNIVDQKSLKILEQISPKQAPIDAAEETLNQYIMTKESIEMTINELVGLGVDTSKLEAESQKVSTSIDDAAVDYAQKK